MAPKRRVFLQFLRGGDTLAVKPLKRSPTIVGSGDASHIRIKGPGIADRHVAFLIEDKRHVVVRNLAGPGQVRVDGEKIRRAALDHGASVDLGPVQIRIEIRTPRATTTRLPVPPKPPPAPLLILELNGARTCVALPPGRHAVGSGHCALRVHDPSVPSALAAWFCTPDGAVFHQTLPGGRLDRCVDGRVEAAGALTMRLTFAGSPLVTQAPDGSWEIATVGAGARSARDLQQRRDAERAMLAGRLTVDFDLPPAELLPPPPPAPRKALSPWAAAPLLILVALAAGMGLRRARAPEPAPPVAESSSPFDSRDPVVLTESAPQPATLAATRATLWRHREAFRCCFDPLVSQDEAANGVLWLSLDIRGDGTVFDAWTHPASTLESDSVETCLHSHLLTMSFPHPERPPLQVAYPFDLVQGRLVVPRPTRSAQR